LLLFLQNSHDYPLQMGLSAGEDRSEQGIPVMRIKALNFQINMEWGLDMLK
jgi:hypothetical protein